MGPSSSVEMGSLREYGGLEGESWILIEEFHQVLWETGSSSWVLLTSWHISDVSGRGREEVS